MTFLYFACCAFALCYLAADARIFGSDTTEWNNVYWGDVPFTQDEEQHLLRMGIVQLRQRLLPINFIREHLSCYFCMGVWAGPTAHVLLWHLYRLQGSPYWLHHPSTVTGWTLGLLASFLIGSCCSYVINAVLHKLES